MLCDDQAKGRIRDLKLQVPFVLMGQNGPVLTPTGREMIYKADFTFLRAPDWEFVVQDVKGVRTKEYIVKAGIMRAMGLPIEEI